MATDTNTDFRVHAHYTLMDTEGAPIRTIVVPLQNEAGEMRAAVEPLFSAQNIAELEAAEAGYSVIDWFDFKTLIVEEVN